jgi:hypothetical protein
VRTIAFAKWLRATIHGSSREERGQRTNRSRWRLVRNIHRSALTLCGARASDGNISSSASRPDEPGLAVVDDKAQRWDGASVHEFSGTYGDYILAKVSKVFPDRLRKAP